MGRLPTSPPQLADRGVHLGRTRLQAAGAGFQSADGLQVRGTCSDDLVKARMRSLGACIDRRQVVDGRGAMLRGGLTCPGAGLAAPLRSRARLRSSGEYRWLARRSRTHRRPRCRAVPLRSGFSVRMGTRAQVIGGKRGGMIHHRREDRHLVGRTVMGAGGREDCCVGGRTGGCVGCRAAAAGPGVPPGLCG